ncbi:MAG: hypothetical protein GY820_37905 [Gammaproteobacteria bacterium]|nr:hypothetical protein [Gammaproteobacteria bacterium]
MNLLFDQNISPRILKLLPTELSNSQQVRFVDLEDASDFEIFQFARSNNFSVVTFDSDFIDLNAINGTPPKIIWLNTGNLTTKNIAELLSRNFETIELYLNSETDEILELTKAP